MFPLDIKPTFDTLILMTKACIFSKLKSKLLLFDSAVSYLILVGAYTKKGAAARFIKTLQYQNDKRTMNMHVF